MGKSPANSMPDNGRYRLLMDCVEKIDEPETTGTSVEKSVGQISRC